MHTGPTGTQTSHTCTFPTKCKGAGLRACMSDHWKSIKGITKNKQKKKQPQAKLESGWRASDWQLEKCGKRRGQTLKKAGSGHFELLSKSEKDESSPWHQPNSRTHTRTEERQGRIHDWPIHPGPWCAINKWQPAYWSIKNNGLKIKEWNKTKKIRSQQCINQVAVIKVNLPAFFGMLTDRQMLPESHGKQNETKITKWQYLFTAILFSFLKKKKLKNK